MRLHFKADECLSQVYFKLIIPMLIDDTASYLKVCNIGNCIVSQVNRPTVTQNVLCKSTKKIVNLMKIGEFNYSTLYIDANHYFFRILTTAFQHQLLFLLTAFSIARKDSEHFECTRLRYSKLLVTNASRYQESAI